MPSRGLVAAALLVGGALVTLASLRRLGREHRLLGRLRREERELALDRLSAEERQTARGLARTGVVQITGRRVLVRPAQLAAFRTRRLRLLLSGSFAAFLLISLVVFAVLRL